jgi:hypothetical protein
MARLKATLMLGLSMLMFAMAWAHSQLGWAEMRAGLQDANVSTEIFGALQMGWYFGTFAFVAFGLLLLHQSMGLFLREQLSGIPVTIVASVMIAFGVLGIVSRGWGMHYAGFLAIGFLVAMAGAIPVGASQRVNKSDHGLADRKQDGGE